MTIVPRSLLDRIYWSFSEPTPPTPEALVVSARDYAADIGCPDPSVALEKKLPLADLRVRYKHGVRDADGQWEDKFEELRVVGPNGRLTGAELLWELHVACQGTVGQNDKHFFEGLELEVDRRGDLPPLYQVVLGS